MTQKSLTHVKNVIFTQAEWACSQGKLIKRGKTDRMQFLDILTLQFCTWVLITLKICSQRSSALICLHLVPRVFHLPSPRGKPQGQTPGGRREEERPWERARVCLATASGPTRSIRRQVFSIWTGRTLPCVKLVN